MLFVKRSNSRARQSVKQNEKYMKAKINVPNIKGYLQAHYRKAIDELGFLNKHIVDQAAWRLDQVITTSPECYSEDKCVHCGCEVSSKVFEDRACEGGCYPEMMNEEEWNKFNTDILEIPLSQSVKEYEVGYDSPGINGTQFKIKLNREHFSINMTPEQIQNIANEYKHYL